jgi:histidinol-phosphate aminotransferase
LNRYADPDDLARLRQRLGAYAGVPHDQLVIGPGSDLLLREMIHAFGGDRKVVMVSPSFLPTVEAARETAAWWTGLRLSPPSFALQPEVLLAEVSEACLVIIDNPNNPTGQVLLDRQTVRALLEKEGTLVVIDEAYHELARISAQGKDSWGGSLVDLVGEHANLAVTRTMDKAFSLAGARIGYAVAGRAFQGAFTSFYPLLPQPSLLAALSALEDPSYVEQNVARLIEKRERVREALGSLDARVYPSHTNFLLIRSRVLDIAALLEAKGVLVLDASNQLPPGFIRVSIGTREENDAFLAAFKRVEEKGERSSVREGTFL